MTIPKLNKIYDYFDDGKVNPSRHYKIKVEQIIPFDDIDNKTLLDWKQEVEECDWVYNKKTDYFIKCSCDDIETELIFVRCTINGWFSLGWEAGRLDIDGTLMKYFNETYNK